MNNNQLKYYGDNAIGYNSQHTVELTFTCEDGICVFRTKIRGNVRGYDIIKSVLDPDNLFDIFEDVEMIQGKLKFDINYGTIQVTMNNGDTIDYDWEEDFLKQITKVEIVDYKDID